MVDFLGLYYIVSASWGRVDIAAGFDFWRLMILGLGWRNDEGLS